jgi:modulator of FtsH protease
MSRLDARVFTQTDSILATNKVLRNTYLLLGMSLCFSAVMAMVAMATNAHVNIFMFLIGAYGLMFLTSALRNSAWGLAAVFAFTGFMGYTLGPILNHYIAAFSNGTQIIATSLGATGVIFFALSGYVLTTKKDFSYMSGFLFIVAITAMLMMLAGAFFHTPAMQLMISSAFILLASGTILMQTSAIIHGGETNYIMATVSLYVSLYNLFISLLQILGMFSRDE